jgi:hypothetical protein
VTVVSASGGAAAEQGFWVYNGENTVIGFGVAGEIIPEGTSGTLISLALDGSGYTCLTEVSISGELGSALLWEGNVCVDIVSCDDLDGDNICDDVDDCVGAYDACGVCNGDGIAAGACDCAGNVLDECGVCGGDGIAAGACDCAGNVDDACGVCGGSTATNFDGDCFINFSIGEISGGSMEILIHNTISLTGFQFTISGVDLTNTSASGGIAAANGFTMATSDDSQIVLGFYLPGSGMDEGEPVIPPGEGVLTNLAFTPTHNEACLSGGIFALDNWPGGMTGSPSSIPEPGR